MKSFYISLAACIFMCSNLHAQKLSIDRSTRTFRFGFIKKDSVNLPYNSNFEMIEESCSQIMRYGHVANLKFTGTFRDVSRSNPDLVISEGNYTADALKDGAFISRNLNGTLLSKGNFKKNKFDGRWEIYYDDGKPKLTFEANGKDINIIDSWDAKGVKTVNNGNGNYQLDLNDMSWKGKLVNGRPDGTWKAIKRSDKTTLLTENYKKGVFTNGNGPLGEYVDAPRVVLYSADLLPYVNAESFKISPADCSGTSAVKNIVNAKYIGGFNSFSSHIQLIIEPYMSKVNLAPYGNNVLIMEGEIDKTGKLVRVIQQNEFDDTLVSGLTKQLYTLPFLQPATVDGKPVSQKINFTFTFTNGVYTFTYKLLPIEVK